MLRICPIKKYAEISFPTESDERGKWEADKRNILGRADSCMGSVSTMAVVMVATSRWALEISCFSHSSPDYHGQFPRPEERAALGVD